MGHRADQHPNRHRAIVDFLDRCHRVMTTLAGDLPATAPERGGVQALAAAVGGAAPVEFEPTWVPVLDTIGGLRRQGPAADLVDRFSTLVRDLPWIPTYRAADGGTELALAPLDRALDLGDTTIGLMYIGPGRTYPLHRHPPQELYLTIAGTGRWRYGGRAEPEEVGPSRLLYNHPDDLHTATAHDDHPLLALYVLW